MENKHLIKDKVVLDVGCGTGILSMFCAKAGAKQVIAVDCSDIIEQARLIVAQNVEECGLPDVITLVKGKMEDIQLPVDKVDVIVSEWMGYFLFYESMLDSVLFARDKFLVEGGVMLPDKATLYLAGIEDGEYKQEKIEWWEDVYGFKMSCMKELALVEPIVDCVDRQQIIASPVPVFSIDVRTCTKEDLDFTVPFKLKADCNDHCHALIGYFDCEFSSSHKKLVLPTGPSHTPTHWKQTVFYLKEVLTMSQGETMTGTLHCSPNAKNHRDLDITIDVQFTGQHCCSTTHQEYRLR